MYHTNGGYTFHLSTNARGDSVQQSFLVKTPGAALRRLKRLQSQGFGDLSDAIKRLSREVN